MGVCLSGINRQCRREWHQVEIRLSLYLPFYVFVLKIWIKNYCYQRGWNHFPRIGHPMLPIVVM
jgi:hypothetical protein